MPPCSSRALTIWLTGIPSSGKTTLAGFITRVLIEQGASVKLLDGDAVRAESAVKLGFTREDRERNLRHISHLADESAQLGIITVVAAISPYRTLRAELAKKLSPFLEVFVNAPVSVCEQRDVKGLYRRYRVGELKGLTGVDDIYEPPLAPDVECRTDLETIEESAAKILSAIHLIGVNNNSEKMENHQTQSKETP